MRNFEQELDRWITREDPCIDAQLSFDDYQGLAAMTLNPSLNESERLGNAAMGMCGESGEVSEIVKKHLYHGKQLDKEALKSETGDVLWYVSLMCECLDMTLEELAQMNIDKLRERYPNGFAVKGKLNE